MFINRIKSRIKRNYLCRKFVLIKDKTIFSNNCLASFIYNDLRAKYLSPTIGIQIPIKDFINFCQDTNSYLSRELKEGDHLNFEADFRKVGGNKIDFPCAYLGDVKIMFQHEKLFSEAKDKWIRRSKRVQRDKLVIIWVHKFELSSELIKLINSIKCEKVILTDFKGIKHKDWYYIKIPKGKEWWQQDRSGIRYFERLNWRKILKERLRN